MSHGENANDSGEETECMRNPTLSCQSYNLPGRSLQVVFLLRPRAHKASEIGKRSFHSENA